MNYPSYTSDGMAAAIVAAGRDVIGFKEGDRVAVETNHKQGSFITDERTLGHMRKVYWRASIINQAGWDSWKAGGGKNVYEHAHERVESILAQHYPPQPAISEKAIAALDGILAEAKAHTELFAL